MDYKTITNKFLKWFKQPRERAGVEFFGNHVRMVHLKKRLGDEFTLSAVGSLAFDVGIQTDLRGMTGEMDRVAVAVEHPSLRVRRMDFAKMPEADLLEGIRWNFREHVDCPLEKYRVTYVPLPEFSKQGEIALVAYGLSVDAVDQIKEKVGALGLKVVSIEPIATALGAVIKYTGILRGGGYIACVNIEEDRANFVVMSSSAMLFSRPLVNASEEKFKKLLIESHIFSEEDAIKYYRQLLFGERVVELDEAVLIKLDAVYKDFMRQLVIEVQRSIDAFTIIFEAERVNSILLCGEGAVYKGLVEHMGSSLGVATAIFNPFAKIDGTTADLSNPSIYSVATGLSIPF